MKWAFLGPLGTYSEMAVHVFAQDADDELSDGSLIACATIEDVFEQVERGRVDYGVVPIENSMEGSVTSTLDCLLNVSDVKIIRETIVDISHSLCGPAGIDKGSVTTVYSHPQALGQCRRYIQRHFPGAQVVAASSTAEAVERVGAQKDSVAIGNSLAAQRYGVQVIENSIEDYAGNQTRFVVITRSNTTNSAKPGELYKTSLALFLKEDKPGALLNILAEFAYGSINLTKLQSRPTKQGLGNYMFFIDLEGHVDKPEIRTALDCLRLKLREVRVLGCYSTIK